MMHQQMGRKVFQSPKNTLNLNCIFRLLYVTSFELLLISQSYKSCFQKLNGMVVVVVVCVLGVGWGGGGGGGGA